MNEFHFEMLKKSFKGGAKLALCPKNLAKSWHDKVVLAALGQFCKELVEGWIPSTTTWSRACAWFIWMVFGQQESCRLPTCISGWLPDFFLTLCALLPRLCLRANFVGKTCFQNLFSQASFSRAVSFGITQLLAKLKVLAFLRISYPGINIFRQLDATVHSISSSDFMRIGLDAS